MTGPSEHRPSGPVAEAAHDAAPSRLPAGAAPREDAVTPAAQTPRDDAAWRAQRIDEFLARRDPLAALRCWVGSLDGYTVDHLVRRLFQDIARIDAAISRQVNVLLHAPAFQKLEASWRGLEYLVHVADLSGERSVEVGVVNIAWAELEADLENAVEFDQSEWFRLVYTDSFGTAGGVPLGLIVADFDVHARLAPDHPHDDVSVVRKLSSVAAAAFCPTVLNAHPSMLELDEFAELEHRSELESLWERPRYVKWNALRQSQDARFISLTLPRVLMRLPYADDGTRLDRFHFVEEASRFEQYLWGGAAFALAAVVLRSFAQSGWFTSLHGVRVGLEDGGLVTGLPAPAFDTDAPGVAVKSCAELRITDQRERELSELGLTALVDCPDTPWSAFYSTPSIQQPQQYATPQATENARISAMTQYMLCVARFAHFLKVIARDKTGAISDAAALERFLRDWIADYITADSSPSPEVKARRPLRGAEIQVREKPSVPGAFECVMQLQPHYERDDIAAMVRLVTEVAPLPRNT
ncbi:MAG: type VI secretion system contractile sheath large subunit [Pirellulaceae bacterium]|nr:type VI secretion system contractile sheath large subunit [Pirellulaceae bacterium]